MKNLDINMETMNLIGYMNRLAEKSKHGYIPEDMRSNVPKSSKFVVFDRSKNLNTDPYDTSKKYRISSHPAFLINGEKVLFAVEYDEADDGDDYNPCICVYIGETYDEPHFIIQNGSWHLFMFGE